MNDSDCVGAQNIFNCSTVFRDLISFTVVIIMEKMMDL